MAKGNARTAKSPCSSPKTHNLVGRHPAIGASDPQVLRRLLALEPLEKIGIGRNHARRPRAVVRFQVIQRVCSDSQNLSKSPRAGIFQRFLRQSKAVCGLNDQSARHHPQYGTKGAPARFSTERIEHKSDAVGRI